ncbi:uncharacterized protein LOC135121955 isoform X1 [Zophobas morio]|uniref:uncharacterized protein LOC135121955 isoform X1 n=1 Tax=Zophobas morio TaxID=2755281 RepID=UPI0030830CFA
MSELKRTTISDEDEISSIYEENQANLQDVDKVLEDFTEFESNKLNLIKRRSDRFDVNNENYKKITRLKRFGLPLKSSVGRLVTASRKLEVKQKSNASGPVDSEELKKRKERARRFGLSNSPNFAKFEEETIRKKRAIRFATH